MILKRNDSEELLNRKSQLLEILVALIHQQKDLELIDDVSQVFNNSVNRSEKFDATGKIERNQRIINKYQSLVRSAITLDALLDSEKFEMVGRKN